MKSGPEKGVETRSAAKKRKVAAEVSFYDQDIIKAFGGLLALASFPEINEGQSDADVLKEQDEIAVRGNDERGPFIKILKKSKNAGYIDSEVLFSEPDPYPECTASFVKAALLTGAVPVVTSCKIHGETHRNNGDHIHNINGLYQSEYDLSKFAERAYQANKMKK